MNLSHFRFPLTITAAAALVALFNACVSSEESPSNDSGGSTMGTTNTSNTSSAGSTTGSGGSTTSAAASTGTATTGATPAINAGAVIDFETYDGASAADGWEFNFNGDENAVGAVYGGLFALSEGTPEDAETPSTSYNLSFVSGADGSTWALSASNDMAVDWGGGIGMWTGNMDASSYTGIQFMLRATTPAGSAGMSLENAAGATVSQEWTIEMPGEWHQVQLPFTGFTSDAGDTTDGSEIRNFSFTGHMVYAQDPVSMEWLPEPGAYELVIDNISFY